MLQCLYWRHRCVTSAVTEDKLKCSIEDAPAPDALHSFKAEISGDMIHVTAKQSDTLRANKSRPPTLRANGYTTEGPGVVIVGGGAGALHAIESLREVREYVQSTVTAVSYHYKERL